MRHSKKILKEKRGTAKRSRKNFQKITLIISIKSGLKNGAQIKFFENYNAGIKTALGYNIIVMCVTIIQQIESNYNIKNDRIEL